MLTAAALRRLSDELEPSPSPFIVPSPEAAPDDDDDDATDDNSGWFVAIATTLVMGALLTLVCVLGVCLCVIALRRYARAPIGAARPAGPPAAMPPCVEKIELPPAAARLPGPDMGMGGEPSSATDLRLEAQRL